VLLCGNCAADEWVSVLDKKNIKAYARTIEGSKLLEFRATTVVYAPIEIIGEILRDIEAYPQRDKYCKEVRLLKRFNRNHLIVYALMDYPAPITDRDLIMEYETQYDFSKGRTITNGKALKKRLVPLKDNCIRITDYKSQYILEYIGKETTGMIYTGRADPEGYIPKFIVNFLSKYAIYNNTKSLVKMTKEKRYINKAKLSEDKSIIDKIINDQHLMRSIIQARLKEYIKDAGFLELIMRDEEMFEMLKNGTGKVGEIILHGWGSHQSKKEAVAVLLRYYMMKFGPPPQMIEAAVNDENLLESILTDRKSDKASVTDVIRYYLATDTPYQYQQ
jgi:hypothetical protein